MFDHIDALVSLQRTISRDYTEQLLNADAEAGAYCNGDVEIWPAERWPLWTDDWRWEPTEMTVLAEQEAAALSAMAEADLVAETIAEYEAEEEFDQAEYEAFLDSLAPSPGKLELRDISDCGLGHQA
jgi:hypothetical protein